MYLKHCVIFIFMYSYTFIECGGACVCPCHSTRGDEKTTCGSWFSPSAMRWWRWHSLSQAWQQAPFRTASSHLPLFFTVQRFFWDNLTLPRLGLNLLCHQGWTWTTLLKITFINFVYGSWDTCPIPPEKVRGPLGQFSPPTTRVLRGLNLGWQAWL